MGGLVFSRAKDARSAPLPHSAAHRWPLSHYRNVFLGAERCSFFARFQLSSRSASCAQLASFAASKKTKNKQPASQLRRSAIFTRTYFRIFFFFRDRSSPFS